MNGYILVGGQSRRMGVDKALLSISGQNICHIIMQKMQDAGCHNVFLVGKEQLSIPIPQIIEPWKEHHPLFGMHTALHHCEDDFCIITPCDTPFVSTTTYQTLRSQSATTVLSTTTKKQPLVGLFSTLKREEALSYAQQHRSVMSFVENEACIIVSSDELHNINHPHDLRDIHDNR